MDFSKSHKDCAKQITSWYNIASSSNWENINQVKDTIPYVSVLSNSRVVFNLKGKDYRLITEMNFLSKIIYICWIGTHAEYDKINANTVWGF